MTPIIKVALVFLFIFSTAQFIYSQSENLVPNPSFEKYRALPNNIGEGKRCLKTWTFPNIIGAGEYYHSDSDSRKANTKNSSYGKQAPHSGKAYAGICISPKVREFLQVELNQPLIKNNQYEIKFHISCADKFYLSAVNEFNVIFSEKSFLFNGSDLLLTPPEVTFKSATTFNNRSEWAELSAVYTANGTEKWMTFGSFPYIENEVEHGETIGLTNYAHYYVDDVSVRLINNSQNAQVENNEIKKEEIKKEFVSGETYILENIQFQTGESVLLEESFSELDLLIQFLLKHPENLLKIVGHTDNTGNPTKNLSLSLERANSVKEYLITDKNINPKSISIEGKGDTKPLVANTTEAGRKVNRRVEFSFY